MRVVRERSQRKRLHALRGLGSLAPHGDGACGERKEQVVYGSRIGVSSMGMPEQ